MRDLARDVKYSFRALLGKPAFTAAALLSLVLGIGTNTAIFTLLDAIFLRPLTVENPSELALIHQVLRSDSGEYTGYRPVSYSHYESLKERTPGLQDMALYHWWRMNLSGGSEPMRVVGMFVSANYFDLLGLRPAIGRFFLPEEDRTHLSHPVVVLSHGSWVRFFGRDEDILGREVQVNGRAMEVVGVGPRGFKGTDLAADVDFWVPLRMFKGLSPFGEYFDTRDISLFWPIARMQPDSSVDQISREVMGVAQQLGQEYGGDAERLGARAVPLLEAAIAPRERDRYVNYGWALAVAVGLVLFIACINVANLLLVRGLERGQEVAIRRAVGAGRGRVVRQLMTENLLLFTLGGLLSLPVARWSLDLLWRWRPPQFAEQAVSLRLDMRVLVFAFAITLVTGLLFGLMPAWRASNPDLLSHLKESTRRRGRMLARWLQPRGFLVVGQVALTLTALVGAGLFVRSLQNALDIDVGFVDGLVALSFAPGEQGYDEARARAYYDRVLETVRALPEVTAAGLSENRLLRGGTLQREVFLTGADRPVSSPSGTAHRTNAIADGFFEAVGIPFVEGRKFTPNLQPDSPPVAIINETMAKMIWPGEKALGKRFHFDYPETPAVEVVGVVGDAKYRYIHEPPTFFVYLPLDQNFRSSMTLHARAKGDPEALIPVLRKTVQALDPSQPLADLHSMDYFVNNALWVERASASLLSVLGLLAVVLASIGVYGVLAQTVKQRQRELGIRLALGARRVDVRRAILGEAARMVIVGLALGLLLSYFLLSRLISSQLYDIAPTDPLTYVALTLLLLAVTLLTCWLPAVKASRTDPMKVLREE